MKNNKTLKIILIVLICVLVLVDIYYGILYFYNKNKLNELKIQTQIEEIKSHYDKYVRVVNDSKLYLLDNNEYIYDGIIGENVELELNDIEINENTNYFRINNLDKEYYIYYNDVKKINELSKKDDRYKRYIPFNENVVTNDTTIFYSNDKMKYTLNKSYDLPIIIKDDDKYYVEYNNELLYVLKNDIKETHPNDNSNSELASQISTILYHFIYDPATEKCNEIICHPKNKVQEQMNYLKENDYFTVKLDEFELWIDGKLNLPKKSIVITVDDGVFGDTMRGLFIENKMNANVFLVTSWFDKKWFNDEEGYVTTYSHTHALHENYKCPGGSQGGAILCYDRETVLNDLKKSRELLDNTKYLSYPFYDYDNRTIELLKEAGYTMGFAGRNAGGHYNMVIGGDKFRIPRITIQTNTTTVDEIKRILATN